MFMENPHTWNENKTSSIKVGIRHLRPALNVYVIFVCLAFISIRLEYARLTLVKGLKEARVYSK